MFNVNKMNKDYNSYQYRGKGEKEGTVTFTPSEYGCFEFRYFPAGTLTKANYQHLGKSNTIRVGPQFSVSAELCDNGKKIKVQWNKISGNTYTSAWIGLFPAGAKNQEYQHWEYATTPELTFEAPFKPGTYELRFFCHSYVCVAVSSPITISGADSLTVSVADKIIYVEPHVLSVDPYRDSVWVGLFLADQQNNRQWVKYKPLKERFNKLQFRFPKNSGTYQVRLFANKSYDVIVSSSPFTIDV